MPRGPRLDAQGILHHVIARGIDRKPIYECDQDREEFLSRLTKVCLEHDARIYAWSLMGNHFHLAVRTGIEPLKRTMSRVLTGYAMYFNRRYDHSGHVFQNRYKSTVVDDERYFLALLRYIHLNPVRAGIVNSIKDLVNYPWSGHSVLMGRTRRTFQDVDAVLRRFGSRVGLARSELNDFMQMEEAKKEEEIFKGGGLRRSMGEELKPKERTKSQKWAYDERILGSSSFVEAVLKRNEGQNKYAVMSVEAKWKLVEKLAKQLCRDFSVREGELYGGSKRRPVSEVRQILSYISYRELSLPAAELGRMMSVSGQAILQSANKAEDTWEGLDLLLNFEDN